MIDPITARVFFLNRKKAGYLALLALVLSITALLFIYVITFSKGVRQVVYHNDIGAIPVITLEFAKVQPYARMQEVGADLQKKFNLQYLYCGKSFPCRMRLKWDKFGGVSHECDVDILAVEPARRFMLKIKDSGGVHEISCMHVDPLHGFYFPVSQADKLKQKIMIVHGKTDTIMPVTVPLGLPAWKIHSSKLKEISGISCVHYNLLEPRNSEEYREWKKNRNQYFSKMSKLYVAHFGPGFFSSLADEVKDKIWRLFSSDDLYGLPNGQLWNAIMGSSLRKNVGSKKFNVTVLPSGNVDDNLAVADKMVKMRTFGTYYTGFRPEMDRMQMLFSHDLISSLPGVESADYNYLALGFKDVTSQKEKVFVQQLGDYIQNDPDFKNVCKMVFWEDVADRKGVDFINSVSRGMLVVGVLMMLVGCWSYCSIRLRFAGNVEKIWQTYLFIGVEKKYWLIIHAGFFLVISLFMAMFVLVVLQVMSLLLNYSFPVRELTRYMFPARSDSLVVIVLTLLFALLVEVFFACKGVKRAT